MPRFYIPTYLFLFICFFSFSHCKSSAVSSSKIGHRRTQIDTEKLEQLRLTVITLAREQIGKKYKRAAKGPENYDCSGLVYYVYGRMEMPMASNSAEQCQSGKKIDLEDAKPGDLIFFGSKDHISHVGILTEQTKDKILIVHSSSSRGVVEENIIHSDYWIRKIRHITSLVSYKKPMDLSSNY